MESPEPHSRPAPREWIAILAIAAGLAATLVSLAWETGVTVDEPSHLLSAVLYWQGEDRLDPRDMPPAIKIAGGWAAKIMEPPVPPRSHPIWKTRHEWNVSAVMMEGLDPESTQDLFFWSRLPLIVFPVATLLLIWWWGRQMVRPWAAVAAALTFALEPTMLGHGSLFKNDLAATFGYLCFWYRAWRFWREPSIANAAWLGAGLLAAILAKMSMLVLVPLVPVLVAARFLTARPLAWKRAVAGLVLALLIPYVGALAACQFETRRIPKAEAEARGLGAPLLVFRVLPVPSPYWRGLVTLIESHDDDNGVYMLGKVYPHGHPAYFLVALAVKVPHAMQALALAGLAAAWGLGPFVLIPPLLYTGMASASSLQLGIRLILPALPFAVLWIARLYDLSWRRRGLRLAAGVLAGWLGITAAAAYPEYIPYFNEASGGPDNGLRYLSGSNLDWGQDLRKLDALRKDLGIAVLKLAYFGMENSWTYFPKGEEEVEMIPSPWSPDLIEGRLYVPARGYYAISSTLLTGQFFEPEYRDYFLLFRSRKPVARAGYSIYVYRIE